jgi:hypothetical protein
MAERGSGKLACVNVGQQIVLHRGEIVGVVCNAAGGLAASVDRVLRRGIPRRPSHAVEGGAKVGEIRTDGSRRRLSGQRYFIGRRRRRRIRTDWGTGDVIDRGIEISVGLTSWIESIHYSSPVIQWNS